MEGAGSWRTSSLPAEEQSVPGAIDTAETPTMLTVSEEDLMEDNDEIEADGTIGSEPSDPDYTPTEHISPDPSEHDYTPTEPEHINSNYEPD
ncbi:unnamed protein product [Lactuca virosa]|uniref:Uncharacterized protein n=1 Tax=Lactuca virosa TaxID=75947 RepID=A0AAU9PM46_9ASTR|nr:unnamed protein product [Lactuca virosa]